MASLPTNKPLPEGSILRSQEREYEVLRVLGTGSFGITYLARTKIMIGNISTFIKVAIKEHFISDSCYRGEDGKVVLSIPSAKIGVEQSRLRFISEANRLKKLCLKTRNIVSVFETFVANGTTYYVMEYLDGDSVSKCKEEEAISIITQIANALDEVHKEKILHLNVSPDNIILNKNYKGEIYPVLIGFGLSKNFDSKGRNLTILYENSVSIGYAPQEQYTHITEFSPKYDIYALGAVLYFLITGKNPPDAFKISPNQQDLKKELDGKASVNIKRAILNAMSSSKHERTENVRSFLEDLCVTVDSENGDAPILTSHTIPLTRKESKRKIFSNLKDFLGNKSNEIENSQHNQAGIRPFLNNSVPQKKIINRIEVKYRQRFSSVYGKKLILNSDGNNEVVTLYPIKDASKPYGYTFSTHSHKWELDHEKSYLINGIPEDVVNCIEKNGLIGLDHWGQSIPTLDKKDYEVSISIAYSDGSLSHFHDWGVAQHTSELLLIAKDILNQISIRDEVFIKDVISMKTPLALNYSSENKQILDSTILAIKNHQLYSIYPRRWLEMTAKEKLSYYVCCVCFSAQPANGMQELSVLPFLNYATKDSYLTLISNLEKDIASKCDALKKDGAGYSNKMSFILELPLKFQLDDLYKIMRQINFTLEFWNADCMAYNLPYNESALDPYSKHIFPKKNKNDFVRLIFYTNLNGEYAVPYITLD